MWPLYLFNPIVTSLRGLQQASELKQGAEQLGCARASLGSLSEWVAVFDSERLKPIIESLGEKLVPIAADKRLKDLQHTLTLVDGSIVEELPRIAMASFREAQSGSGKKIAFKVHGTCVCKPHAEAWGYTLPPHPRRIALDSIGDANIKRRANSVGPFSILLGTAFDEIYQNARKNIRERCCETLAGQKIREMTSREVPADADYSRSSTVITLLATFQLSWSQLFDFSLWPALIIPSLSGLKFTFSFAHTRNCFVDVRRLFVRMNPTLRPVRFVWACRARCL